MQAPWLPADRKPQSCTGINTISLHAAAIYLQHIFCRSVRPARDKASRRSMPHRGHKASFRIEKQHVERDQGVLHPELANGHPPENKQHAGVRRKPGTMHQPVGVLLRRGGQLDTVCQGGAVVAIKQERGRLEDRPVNLATRLACTSLPSGEARKPCQNEGQQEGDSRLSSWQRDSQWREWPRGQASGPERRAPALSAR